MTKNQRHLTQLDGPNGLLFVNLGEPLSVAQTVALAGHPQMGPFASNALNEPLMAALDAHPSFTAGYRNNNTKVLISCEGAQCGWATSITSQQDKYGHGSELFRAHLSLKIEEAFTLEPRH